jgi:hypothetical protein
MWRWVAAALTVLVIAGIWFTGLVGFPHGTGYFSPVFTPDGQSIVAVRRAASAVTVGFGYEFFSPPATVFIRDDRYALVQVGVKDHRLSILGELPVSPVGGRRLQSYHGSIFGSSSSHLRWEHGRLSYEVSVTRHDSPLSRTFVARGQWDPTTRRFAEVPAWREAYATSGGDEPDQLAGALEVIALPGSEGLPCGIVTVNKETRAVTSMVMTPVCHARYPSPSLPEVSALSRRADIERTITINQTYKRLVAEGVATGANEGVAMLRANKEMERLGYFPRSPTLTAVRSDCRDEGTTFHISDEEFRVGLFQDIEQAIAQPGVEVDKSTTEYVRHQAFDTSRQINEYLTNRSQTRFYVQTRNGCWQMTIKH